MNRRPLIAAAVLASTAVIFVAVIPDLDQRPVGRFSAISGDTAIDNARAEYRARGDSAIALDRALERAVAMEAAGGVRRSSAPVAFSADPSISANVRAGFASVADAQLASLGTPNVPVRIVLVPIEDLGSGYRHVAVLPSSATEPCVSVLQVASNGLRAQPEPNDRLVGVCGFYARYGMPGRGVLAWIDSSYSLTLALDVAPPTPPRDPKRRDSFSGYTIALAPSTAACIAGRVAACASAVAGADWMQIRFYSRGQLSESDARIVRTSSYAPRWAPSSYFARMRDHVGDEAFTKIWTSDAAPPLAYEQVMGESFAEFARPLLLEELKPHTPGPLHADFPLVLSLSVGALCAAWAIRRTRRARS